MRKLWSLLLCLALVTYSYSKQPVIAWQKVGHANCDRFIVSPNGKRLGTSSNVDVTVKLWDIVSGKYLGGAGFSSPYTNIIYPKIDTLAFTPHGSQLNGSIGTLYRYYRTSVWTEPYPTSFFTFIKENEKYNNLQSTILWDEQRVLYRYDTSGLKTHGSIFVLLDNAGKQIKRWFFNKEGLTRILASPDTVHFAAFNSKTGEVLIMDINTGAEVKRVKSSGHFISDARFSLDGRYLVADADTNIVQVWDWWGGNVTNTLQLQSGPRIYSNDGMYVLQNWQVYRTLDGSVIHTLHDSNDYPSVALAHDGVTLQLIYQNAISDDPTGQVYIENLNTNETRTLFDVNGPATALAFAEGSRYLVSAHGDVLRVWDVQSRTKVAERALGNEVSIIESALNGTDVLIGYTSIDTIDRFDAVTLSRKQYYASDSAPAGKCTKIREATNGKLFVLYSKDTLVYGFDASTATFQDRKPFPFAGASFEGVDVSHDGHSLAISDKYNSSEGSITHIFDIASGSEVKTVHYPRGFAYFEHTKYSPDDSKLFAGWGFSDYVEVWAFAEYNFFFFPTDTALFVNEAPNVYGCTLAKAAWNHEGTAVYAVSDNIGGGVWNKLGAFIRIGMDSARDNFSVGTPSAQTCIAVSQDAYEYIATAGLDGTITLWCMNDCTLDVPNNLQAGVPARPYPNPASISAAITYSSPISTTAPFMVYDLVGKRQPVLYTIDASTNTVTFDVSQLAAGIYVVHSPDDPNLSARFVKMNK